MRCREPTKGDWAVHRINTMFTSPFWPVRRGSFVHHYVPFIFLGPDCILSILGCALAFLLAISDSFWTVHTHLLLVSKPNSSYTPIVGDISSSAKNPPFLIGPKHHSNSIFCITISSAFHREPWKSRGTERLLHHSTGADAFPQGQPRWTSRKIADFHPNNGGLISKHMNNLENPMFTERTSTNLGRSHHLPHIYTMMIYDKLWGVSLAGNCYIYAYIIHRINFQFGYR